MSLAIFNFILGVVNVFIAGMNCSMIIIRKKDGIRIDYKDHLATLLPVTVGVYLLIHTIGQLGGN
jgi:hypothetical protein